MTLLELVLVVAVMAILAGMVVPLLGGVTDTAQNDGTRVSLSEMRDVIMGREGLPGYYGDLRRIPTTVADLFRVNTTLPAALQSYDPQTRQGWRGPYLMYATGGYGNTLPPANPADPTSSYYAAPGDPAIRDAWGRPIVIQWPTVGTAEQQQRFVRLVSAGPDGIIQTPPTALTVGGNPWPAPSQRGDDIVVFLRVADVDPDP
jgi:type II secretory pathway pseudopilin PulG